MYPLIEALRVAFSSGVRQGHKAGIAKTGFECQ